MRIFLSIKTVEGFSNRKRIESICRALEACGHSVVCNARDLEQWGEHQFTPRQLMQQTFKEINGGDFVLVEFTEKGVGLGTEAGYAYARGIPVIAAGRTGADLSTTLEGVASRVVFYNSADELIPVFYPADTNDLLAKASQK